MILRDHRLAAMWVAVLSVAACTGGASAVPGDQAINVGLVVSLTGADRTTAELAIQGATVAIAKANSEHMVANRQLRLVKADDASRPDAAGPACSQLVTKNQLVAIVGFESAGAINACSRATSAAVIPYFAAGPSGADVCLPNVFVFGFTPNQEVTPLIEYLAQKQSARRFFILATDNPNARSLAEVAATKVHDGGGVLLSTVYRPAMTLQFRTDIAAIAAGKPDIVLDGLVGDDELAFHRQFVADPRVAGVKRASLFLDASTARSIGPAAVGVIVAQDYNSTDSSPATQAWHAALVAKYGDGAIPSAIGAEVYDATLFAATAIGQAQSNSGPAIASAAGSVSFVGPRGTIHVLPTAHGYATVSAHIGRVSANYVIDQLDVSGPVDPAACVS